MSRAAEKKSAVDRHAARVRAEDAALPVTTKRGLFPCIVADPPWPVEQVDRRNTRPNQVGFSYPPMPLVDIEAVAVPAAPNTHLFLWTTEKFLPAAINRVLPAWGFRYVLVMVWLKPGGMQPIGLPQYNCEFVVYARRGTPKFRSTRGFACGFCAPRGDHSRKPDEFYNVVRRVTAGPRLDMFSRERRAGFSQHGKQTGWFK